MPRVIAVEKLTEYHTAYEIEAPEVASTAAAGQLLMARLGEQVRFTPHAIADFEPDKGTVTIVVRSAAVNGGKPSGEIPEHGEVSIDLTGPLGKTDTRCPSGKVLCVADSLGVAALYPRLREYKKNGCYTVVIAGYPSKDQVYWQERLDGFGDELYVVTEDGTFGIRGPIQQTVRAVCRHVTDIERALAVGPLPFLKACANATRNYEIPTWISLNAVIEHEDDLTPGGGAVRTPGEPESGGDTTRAPGGEKMAGAGAASTGSGHDISARADKKPFDWHNVTDLDGHTVDFDRLTEQLGIPPAK